MGFLSYIYGIGDAQAKGDSLDTQLAAMNKARYDSGGYTDEQYQSILADQASGSTGNVDQQMTDAFNTGLKEGGQNVGSVFSSIGTSIGASLNGLFQGVGAGVLKAIPWYFWVAALLVLFVSLGGFKGIKRLTGT